VGVGREFIPQKAGSLLIPTKQSLSGKTRRAFVFSGRKRAFAIGKHKRPAERSEVKGFVLGPPVEVRPTSGRAIFSSRQSCSQGSFFLCTTFMYFRGLAMVHDIYLCNYRQLTACIYSFFGEPMISRK